MSNLLGTFERLAQAITQNQRKRRFKATTGLNPECKPARVSSVRQPFPIWQVTVPLGIVLIFAIGALTAYSMVEGRYLFDLLVSREQIRIRTDVDKREGRSTEEEETTSDNGTPGVTMPIGHTQARKGGR